MARLTYDPSTDLTSKTERMPFQEKATKRLVEIFSTHSRAFLADEAGLGKTYTATGVMEQLADKQWAAQGKGKETPFFVLYVAPNQALLEKCCKDIVDKGRTENEIVKLEIDRLLHLPSNRTMKNTKKIALLATSIHVLGGFVINDKSSTFGSSTEKALVDSIQKENGGKSWNQLTQEGFARNFYWSGNTIMDGAKLLREPKEIERLKEYGFGMVVFDEYHRYFTELSQAKSIFHHEKSSNCKVLFISATPYQGNVKDMGIDDDIADEDGTGLKTLPSLEAFSEEFKGGEPALQTSLVTLDEAYKEAFTALADAPDDIALQQQAKNGQEALQTLLQQRMVRHERTQLSAGQTPEPHSMPFQLAPETCKTQLLQMRHQILALQKGGYGVGAQNWSRFMPWLLSFSTKYKTSITRDRKSNYFQFLDSNKHRTAPDSRLFYHGNKISTLPKQNIAFAQLCQANVTAELAQLIWMPPTIPAYKIPENSLFAKWKHHSKLLVFGEYKYLQRGGAMLLSQYAQSCNHGNWDQSTEYSMSYADTLPQLPPMDCRKSMDELVAEWGNDFGYDETTALACLASPAACAGRLGLPAKAVESAFNVYFNRPEIKDALCTWADANGYAPGSMLTLLRYCAEGNLFAVLREWQVTNPRLDAQHIRNILNRTGSTVHLQTPDTYHNKSAGVPYTCALADRLTLDFGDTGSTGDDKSHLLTQQAFNSPFYPMILFAGRGAQEGLDFHQYCLRIMHLTLPRGAVSFDQRQGRIDRFRSLLVRRRAAEVFGNLCSEDPQVFERVFNQLKNEKCTSCATWKNDQLFPNWQIKEFEGYRSEHHFQRMVPITDFTDEALNYKAMEQHLFSYRSTIGSSGQEITDAKYQINLSAK